MCVHTRTPTCMLVLRQLGPSWQEALQARVSSTACEPALRLQNSADLLGAPKLFVPSSPAAQIKACACRCVFGRRLFWEPPPELLLVLMLCDNTLSCLSLVYAGHEKALCAALGAGCQLGLVRRSLCAPQLHPPRPSCLRGLIRPCTNSHSTGGSRALLGELFTFCSSRILDGGNIMVTSSCSTSRSSRQVFPLKKTFPALVAMFLQAV